MQCKRFEHFIIMNGWKIRITTMNLSDWIANSLMEIVERKSKKTNTQWEKKLEKTNRKWKIIWILTYVLCRHFRSQFFSIFDKSSEWIFATPLLHSISFWFTYNFLMFFCLCKTYNLSKRRCFQQNPPL